MVKKIQDNRMKVLNFLLRMVFGAIGIQIINAILISQNVGVFVGLNILTLLTAGSLGISGVGLLYGISAFGIL
ncbi:MAG: Pro-sigmaK processing inhibitor BofA [Lachnospiraceae bacterium]|jgi:hypothetical protein|nr:Pro-sigmaK processing inhibitor BofA [Lachnospiraceae bacterium]MCI9305286.1 Pro-sigmaK processing inhibitor BofA [Lachnospiraceae bacterium]